MGVGSERPRDPQHSQQSSVKKTPIKSIKMGDKEANLRGQVINKPKEQMWMVKSDADLEEYKYTCEPGHMEWTPLNSNLTMQGIKVQVNRPIPETTISRSRRRKQRGRGRWEGATSRGTARQPRPQPVEFDPTPSSKISS